MAIVHVSVISGCLLASNNPSTTTALVSEIFTHSQNNDIELQVQTEGHQNMEPRGPLNRARGLDRFKDGKPAEFTSWKMSPVFADTPFLPVSLWDRGRMKRAWIENSEAYKQNKWFQERMRMGKRSFSLLAFAAFIMVSVPTGLSIIVSFTTPRVCVSCRYVNR